MGSHPNHHSRWRIWWQARRKYWHLWQTSIWPVFDHRLQTIGWRCNRDGSERLCGNIWSYLPQTKYWDCITPRLYFNTRNSSFFHINIQSNFWIHIFPWWVRIFLDTMIIFCTKMFKLRSETFSIVAELLVQRSWPDSQSEHVITKWTLWPESICIKYGSEGKNDNEVMNICWFSLVPMTKR